jgi:predicted transcriptional regulator
MKQIRVLKREGHALSQDVASCVSTLKTADIWAYPELLEYAGWRTIDIVSELPDALAILRREGFEVRAG